MLFHKSLYISDRIRSALTKIGIAKFQDFMNYSTGKLVSRPSKRHVRTLFLDVGGQKKKYFLKQAGAQSFRVVLKDWRRFKVSRSDTARELLLLKLFDGEGIPVMTPVAWGDCRMFGWSVGSFLLVEEVIGREFVDVYRMATLRSRRRLMWVHGELMGTLHHKEIESKVHPRDLICVSEDYSTFRTCLVVIDRERGRTHPVTLSIKERGEMLAEIWVKGAFTLGQGEKSEILSFLSGYISASGLNKAMYGELVHCVLWRAVNILERDQRFRSLRQSFKDMYGKL